MLLLANNLLKEKNKLVDSYTEEAIFFSYSYWDIHCNIFIEIKD